MGQNHHDEIALSKRELAWKKDALVLAEGLVEKYANEAPSYHFDAKLLDKTFSNAMNQSWWRRERKFILITGLGYALGQNLVDKLGFEWIVFKDFQGKDVAVKHRQSGLICFPISSVRKRLQLKQYSFMGEYIEDIKNQLNTIKMELPKLHYVSQAKEGLSHLDAIEQACKAGCKWVQLRMKDASFDEFLAAAKAAKKICEQYDAKLTINDNTQVALDSGADGLHLGKEDMAPSEARQIVGDIIIGGTANSWDDIQRLAKEKVDYIGLGPFRYTATKEKLSPILGLEGYKELIQKMNKAGIDIPVLAIGGIGLDDIPAIMDTGVWGIAVSGLITNAENQEVMVGVMHEAILS